MKQIKLITSSKLPVAMLLCVLWLAACAAPTVQTGESGERAETRTRLNVAAPFMPEILDGQQSYGGTAMDIEQIGQALIRINAETGELLPDLAESWAFSEDGKTMTFTLPAGALYSNGDPLDAQAVADALLRNKEVSPYASDFEALTDVSVVDATTLELIFSDPPAAFLTVLNTIYAGPWDVTAAQEMGNEAFATAPIASGPLMVQEFTPGSELLLVRNENYQTDLPLIENQGPIHLAEVLVRLIPEDMTLAGELETGAVDLIIGAPASAIDRLRENPEIDVYETQRPDYYSLAMNLEQPFFSDVRVRQAIAKAVDRAALVKVLNGTTPVHAFINPAMVAYSAEMEAYGQELHPHDVVAAQALLADAGWADTDGDGIVEKDGESFTVEFLVASNAVADQQASQVLQNQLKAVGIDLQISQQDSAYVREVMVAGDYDMGFDAIRWPDPDILSLIFSAPFWNFPQYDNPALIDKMVAARYVLDPVERTAAYAEIQQELLDKVVEIPLWQSTFYIAVRDDVQGLVLNNAQIFLNDVMIVE